MRGARDRWGTFKAAFAAVGIVYLVYVGLSTRGAPEEHPPAPASDAAVDGGAHD